MPPLILQPLDLRFRYEFSPRTMAEYSAPSTRLRVLVVDDFPVWRTSVRSLLDSDDRFEICGEAATVKTALEKAMVLKPDIAIVDLSLGAGNGLDVVAGLKECLPAVRIVVLSMRSESTYGEVALRFGALAYVMKQEAMENLIPALDRVTRGYRWLSQPLAQQLRLASTP